jgi:pimeloyl-ACP methyl ester carboxylesterase
MSSFRIVLILLVPTLVAVIIISVWALNETDKRLKQLEAERSIVESRYGRIEYVSWGEGPPVLVIHGAGGGFDQGRLLAKAVGGDGNRWIAVSRFGYLGSDLPSDPSIVAQAGAFAALLDQLELQQVHILAMSGGVPPALKFAELYPERTGRMVVLSSAPFTPYGPDVKNRPIPTWMYSVLIGNDVAYWVMTKIARGALAEAFDARAELRANLSSQEAAFVQELIDTFLPASQRLAGIRNEAAAVDPELIYDLEDIQVDVIVVHTRDDRLNPFEIGETISSRIKGARLLPLASGGHLVLGHHDELRERIEVFFSFAGE